MKDKKTAEALAAVRFQLLAPLMDPNQDAAKALKLRTEIAKQAGLSERTLRRYLSRYQEGGFLGLAPLGKGKNPGMDTIPSEIRESGDSSPSGGSQPQRESDHSDSGVGKV